MMNDSTHQAPVDTGPPPPPTNPLAKLARELNRRFPRAYFVLSLGPRLALARMWLRRVKKEGAGRSLSDLDIVAHRTSDTVFILGTGASINDYPDSHWRTIETHDSISMNFFLLHDHVPTFHVMETVREPRRTLLETRYRDPSYRDVPLILKTQLSNLSPRRVRARINTLGTLSTNVRSNAYLSLDLLASGDSIRQLESSYRASSQLGLWSPRRRFLVLTKRRGSVAFVINLAARMGYRRIVLCGIDLNHTEYFYDRMRRDLEAAGLPVPENRELGVVHSTNDPENDPITMQQVISIIDRIVLEPAGIDLEVGSPSSALVSDLPLFEWESETIP